MENRYNTLLVVAKKTDQTTFNQARFVRGWSRLKRVVQTDSSSPRPQLAKLPPRSLHFWSLDEGRKEAAAGRCGKSRHFSKSSTSSYLHVDTRSSLFYIILITK